MNSNNKSPTYNSALTKRSALSWRVGLLLVSLVVYVLVFEPLYRVTGGGVGGALAIIPIALAAWFWGLRGGLISAVIGSLLTAYLIDIARGAGGQDTLRSLLGPGTWMLIFSGAVVGYLRDVRENLNLEIQKRGQTEDSLREKESSLAEAQRIAQLGHWDWAIERNNLHWSDEIYRIFGLAPEQFEGSYEAFLEYVHPEDRSFVMQKTDDALYHRIPYSIDHRIVQPGGQERVVHEQAEVTYGDDGQPIRMIGTVHDITERKRAEKTLQKQAQELQRSNTLLSSLGSITAKIRAIQEVDQVIELVHEELSTFDFEYLLGFWEAATQEAVFESTSLAPKLLSQLKKLGLDLQGYRLKADKLTVLPQLLKNPIPEYYTGADLFAVLTRSLPEIIKPAADRIFRIAGFGPDTGMVFLPLFVEQEVKGFLYFWGSNLRQSDADSLNIFANHMSIAIDTARLFQAERKQRQLAEALRDTSAALTSTLDFDTVMMLILENVGKVVPSDAANIMLIEEGQVRLAYWHDYSDPYLEQIKDFCLPMDHAVLDIMARTKEPLVIPDTANSTDWVKVFENEWVKSFLATPLVFHGRVIGFLNLDSSKSNTLKEDYIKPLQIFANQAVLAIENARLFEQTDEQLQQTNKLLLETNQQLVEQTEQLRRALQVKTAFMQRMTHELRTPLNAVIGFAGMLQSQRAGVLNEKQSRYVENIHHSGENLLGLINDVLDLTALETGEVELSLQPVLVSDLFVRLGNQLAEKAQNKGIHLMMDSGDPELKIWGDNARLGQILFELLDNAVKFTPEGGQVSAHCLVLTLAGDRERLGFLEQFVMQKYPLDTDNWLVNSGNCILITVADTGIGIKAEDHPKIFAQLEQVENPLDRQQEGSGLGLALTKSLVELHGGRIWFESDGLPGEGTTFYVALPSEDGL